jgi:hypothetical protein
MPPLFQAVATKLNELVQGEFDSVPIPNSSATVKDKAEFRLCKNRPFNSCCSTMS